MSNQPERKALVESIKFYSGATLAIVVGSTLFVYILLQLTA